MVTSDKRLGRVAQHPVRRHKHSTDVPSSWMQPVRRHVNEILSSGDQRGTHRILKIGRPHRRPHTCDQVDLIRDVIAESPSALSAEALIKASSSKIPVAAHPCSLDPKHAASRQALDYGQAMSAVRCGAPLRLRAA